MHTKTTLVDFPRISRRTEKAIRELEDLYATGLEASAETRTKSGKPFYGRAAIATFAVENRTSKSPVYLARQFAETFSQEEFDGLIELSETHDFPIGVSHVSVLVRVHDAKLRGKLTRQLVDNRWSVKRLEAEQIAATRS
jgi:hypothetical protein